MTVCPTRSQVESAGKVAPGGGEFAVVTLFSGGGLHRPMSPHAASGSAESGVGTRRGEGLAALFAGPRCAVLSADGFCLEVGRMRVRVGAATPGAVRSVRVGVILVVVEHATASIALEPDIKFGERVILGFVTPPTILAVLFILRLQSLQFFGPAGLLALAHAITAQDVKRMPGDIATEELVFFHFAGIVLPDVVASAERLPAIRACLWCPHVTDIIIVLRIHNIASVTQMLLRILCYRRGSLT